MALPTLSSGFEQIPDLCSAQLEWQLSVSLGVIPSTLCTSQRSTTAQCLCSPPGLQPPTHQERNSP